MEKQLTTPIAFMVFNRPQKTQRVFAEIRKVRPTKLFIIADGPRNDAEREKSDAVRAVIHDVDWPCEVHTNFSETNLGCKNRIASGISWVFEHVDRAIFLEDDCLPDQSFFPYCAELLERYKDDERVMHISGDNFQANNPSFVCNESYYFSLISHIWGWATWRRAWKYYDVDISLFPETEREHWMQRIFTDPDVADRWEYKFRQYYKHLINSWDGQWAFTVLVNHGLAINPKTNLITNIGFDAEATHLTTSVIVNNNPLANISTSSLTMPLTHPSAFIVNTEADAYSQREVFEVNKFTRQKIISFAKRYFPKTYAFLIRLAARQR